MYAILQQSGHQYRVSPGDRLLVDRLSAEVGSVVALEPVVLVQNDDGTQVGTPVVDGARVAAVVVSHRKGAKLRVFKFKPKKHYRRTHGHRSLLTELRVEALLAAGEPLPAAPAPAAKAEVPAPATARTRSRAKAQPVAEPEAEVVEEAPVAKTAKAPKAPKAEAPTADAPQAEAPTADAPQAAAPAADAPQAEAAETPETEAPAPKRATRSRAKKPATEETHSDADAAGGEAETEA